MSLHCVTREPYLRDGVEVDVDDFVEVSHDHLRDVSQLLEVELEIFDETVERDGRQIADSHLTEQNNTQSTPSSGRTFF